MIEDADDYSSINEDGIPEMYQEDDACGVEVEDVDEDTETLCRFHHDSLRGRILGLNTKVEDDSE